MYAHFPESHRTFISPQGPPSSHPHPIQKKNKDEKKKKKAEEEKKNPRSSLTQRQTNVGYSLSADQIRTITVSSVGKNEVKYISRSS